jgi:hypothetical protein
LRAIVLIAGKDVGGGVEGDHHRAPCQGRGPHLLKGRLDDVSISLDRGEERDAARVAKEVKPTPRSSRRLSCG